MQELPRTWGIIESQKDSIDAMPEGYALLQPNTEYNRRGARRGNKLLTTLRSSAPSAVESEGMAMSLEKSRVPDISSNRVFKFRSNNQTDEQG